jgi:succinate-acetate transporter protein
VGIAPTAVAGTQKIFVISWIVIVALLMLAALRLPVAFLALFTVAEAALVLDLVGIINTSANLTKAAGWVIMAFAALAVYLFASTASKVAGGKEFPLGKPLLH